MTTNDNLRQLRKQNHLTQEQMAEKIGMTKNGYSKLERGETQLKIERLQQIAHIFNIDVTELLKDNGDFNILMGDNYSNFQNYYENQQEIENLQTIIDYQKELLAQKDKEIELLRKLLEK